MAATAVSNTAPMSNTQPQSGGVPPLLAANRINIPAVCRIPGRGTATLISPGLLLTSTRVVGNKQQASRLKAVFFESGKRERVEVALLPNQTYFAASYPEHLDYCIVACETKGIFNVAPVKLPLVRAKWPQVREGDTVLVVQHPAMNSALGQNTSSSTATAQALATEGNEQQVELKRFEEVQRRRDDLIYFKENGTYTCAGCPVFNDDELLGLQMQYYDETNTEVPVSRMVSVVSIVKHLFANGQLHYIQQQPEFDAVWETWNVPGDANRIVSMIYNFRHKACALPSAIKLCEFACSRENVKPVIDSGGTKVIIECIERHLDNEAFVGLALRAMWTISFGEEDNRVEICEANGVNTVLCAMERYSQSEEISQFAIVLLYNVTLNKALVTDVLNVRGVSAVFAAMGNMPKIEVIQKFGIGFFHNIVSTNITRGRDLIDAGAISHTTQMMMLYQTNEFLIEHGVKLISKIACAPQYHGLPALACCVTPVIKAMSHFPSSNGISVEGNNALWGLGNDPRNRIAILASDDGVAALRGSIGTVVASQPIVASTYEAL